MIKSADDYTLSLLDTILANPLKTLETDRDTGSHLSRHHSVSW